MAKKHVECVLDLYYSVGFFVHFMSKHSWRRRVTRITPCSNELFLQVGLLRKLIHALILLPLCHGLSVGWCYLGVWFFLKPSSIIWCSSGDRSSSVIPTPFGKDSPEWWMTDIFGKGSNHQPACHGFWVVSDVETFMSKPKGKKVRSFTWKPLTFLLFNWNCALKKNWNYVINLQAHWCFQLGIKPLLKHKGMVSSSWSLARRFDESPNDSENRSEGTQAAPKGSTNWCFDFPIAISFVKSILIGRCKSM